MGGAMQPKVSTSTSRVIRCGFLDHLHFYVDLHLSSRASTAPRPLKKTMKTPGDVRNSHNVWSHARHMTPTAAASGRAARADADHHHRPTACTAVR